MKSPSARGTPVNKSGSYFRLYTQSIRSKSTTTAIHDVSMSVIMAESTYRVMQRNPRGDEHFSRNEIKPVFHVTIHVLAQTAIWLGVLWRHAYAWGISTYPLHTGNLKCYICHMCSCYGTHIHVYRLQMVVLIDVRTCYTQLPGRGPRRYVSLFYCNFIRII